MTHLPIPLEIVPDAHEESIAYILDHVQSYLLLRHPLLGCWALYDKRGLALVPAQPTQAQAYERECERRNASIRSALTISGNVDLNEDRGLPVTASFNRYYVRGGEIELL